MRELKFFALACVMWGAWICSPAKGGVRQDQPFNSNFVVIGAFAIKSNAVKFTSYAKGKEYDARFDLNPNRNLYYVFILRTDDHEAALSEAVRLRQTTEFTDAWVYDGTLGAEAQVGVSSDINPETTETIEDVIPSDSSHAGITIAEETENTQEIQNTDASSTNAVQDTEEVAPADEEVSGKKFYFHLYRAVDSKDVAGDVDIIDPDRSRKLASYRGNESVRIAEPNNKSGELTVMCEVFGYRKQQRNVDYASPSGEGVSFDDEGNVLMPFELVRLQKGDVAIMYNVYFFKDAGVMRPESRYEVNSLLEMLNENPHYKIKIHGHTNGNASGKIISLGETRNFFSLTGTKEGYGSAKKLSEERALVIKEYLVNEGIDPGRMHIKAWGGKRAIHDKHSNRANENVRVEIEILADK